MHFFGLLKQKFCLIYLIHLQSNVEGFILHFCFVFTHCFAREKVYHLFRRAFSFSSFQNIMFISLL